MAPDEDEIEDMDPASSDRVEDVVDAHGEQPGAETEAESSAATDDTDGAFSVVRDVVGDRGDEPEAAASSAEGEDQSEDSEDPGDGAPEQDDENYTDVPFHKHPRFQQLLRQRNEAVDDATRYRNVENFLETSGLSGEDAAEGLQVLALARIDPVAAWERMKPFVQHLVQAAGVVMPDDLRQRVESGELSREAAREIAGARAQVASQEARGEHSARIAERRQHEQAQQAVVKAAQSWEDDRRIKDPNFATKVEPLQREVAFLQRSEGVPRDPAGVKDQLDRAYRTINARFVAPGPRTRQRTSAKPVNGGQVAGNSAHHTPRNTLDIIEQVAAARG